MSALQTHSVTPPDAIQWPKSSYVLVMLFMKYVSDRYAGQPDALIVVPEGGRWQVWQLGTLKLEWGEALTVASKSRSGLSLSWPAIAARCRF